MSVVEEPKAADADQQQDKWNLWVRAGLQVRKPLRPEPKSQPENLEEQLHTEFTVIREPDVVLWCVIL